MSRGADFPQPYPALSIIHASVLCPPPGSLPSSRNKVFLQFTFLVNVYLLAPGPLSGRLPHLNSMLQAAPWDMEGKLLHFFLAQLGLPFAPPELKMWAPWQRPPPSSLPQGQQRPEKRPPVAPALYPFSSQTSSAPGEA